MIFRYKGRGGLTPVISDEDIDKGLTELNPIKFNDTVEIKSQTLEEFVSEFFKLSVENATLYLDDRCQCFSYHSRTITDLYRACRYYFPNEDVNIKRIRKAFYKVYQAGEIYLSYCSDIKQMVHKSVNPKYGSYQINSINEFGYMHTEWMMQDENN